MCIVAIAAVASVAISAYSAVSSQQAAKKNAKNQQAYNAEIEAQNTAYRGEVMQYQNEVWKQDIEYANDMLAWSEGEWDRQTRYDIRNRQAIEKNTLAGIGQVLLRQVEEDMAVVMQGMETRRTGQQARGQIAARDRGVEGNSVDAILQDVARQEGEALNVMAMNRSATTRQLNREAIALDAQGDQSLASLQLKTYAPNAQIRMPSPVSPVNPAAPVAQPSSAAMITGMAGSVMQGVTNYSSWSGQKVSDTASDLGTWLGRQFTITPTAGG